MTYDELNELEITWDGKFTKDDFEKILKTSGLNAAKLLSFFEGEYKTEKGNMYFNLEDESRILKAYELLRPFISYLPNTTFVLSYVNPNSEEFHCSAEWSFNDWLIDNDEKSELPVNLTDLFEEEDD